MPCDKNCRPEFDEHSEECIKSPRRSFEEVKTMLADSDRYELQDHAFGDAEVSWSKDGKRIAGGYFGSSETNVSGEDFSFNGVPARELRKLGRLHVERNDETGPDEYVEGKTMPGLTLEGVYEELTGEKYGKS